ncbi:hypothetical protein GCM10009087_25070 [Sphingomonas oligophenolica]|uniref:SGNH/GDSL hydrolase family protein n=1 Tax=Sphingomonas oligophenolica TaxID=301154 RepID=A0ABU9Y9L4_9SPHN
MSGGGDRPARAGPGRRGISALAFTLVLLATALVLRALPYPRSLDIAQFRKIHATSARIAVLGPSTIDNFSICDRDRRTIPQMMADDSGAGVADISSGGQQVRDAVNLAALAARRPSITDVVLAISPASIDEPTTPPYRKAVLYRMLAPSFNGAAFATVQDLWQGLSDQPLRGQRAFTVAGRRHGDYAAVSAVKFAREYRLQGCPEPATHDVLFTHDYYWWMYVAEGSNSALPRLLARLDGDVRRQGKRLHVVLLPANMELIGRLDPRWPRIVMDRNRRFAATLRHLGIDLLDLSDQLPDAQFMQRWCACTHLAETGRRHVALAIDAHLAGHH